MELCLWTKRKKTKIGFFSRPLPPSPTMFWSQVTKPSPNLKEGKIETLKLKKIKWSQDFKTSFPKDYTKMAFEGLTMDE
jgi:hypothetical protein